MCNLVKLVSNPGLAQPRGMGTREVGVSSEYQLSVQSSQVVSDPGLAQPRGMGTREVGVSSDHQISVKWS